MERAVATERDRFWSFVDKREACWIWTGGTTRGGYGYFRLSHSRKSMRAHRFAYYDFHGPFDPSMFVLHHCDNPRCVRPDHLFLGDQKANIADMVAKGRHAEQQKTHCPSGHELTPENNYPGKNGSRRCRECHRASGRLAYQRRMAKNSAK